MVTRNSWRCSVVGVCSPVQLAVELDVIMFKSTVLVRAERTAACGNRREQPNLTFQTNTVAFQRRNHPGEGQTTPEDLVGIRRRTSGRSFSLGVETGRQQSNPTSVSAATPPLRLSPPFLRAENGRLVDRQRPLVITMTLHFAESGARCGVFWRSIGLGIHVELACVFPRQNRRCELWCTI